MSARACFPVLSRPVTESELPSRSHHPRILANNNSSGLGGFCRFRGPHEGHADERFGLTMQSTAAWHVMMTYNALWGIEVRIESGGVL